MRFNREKNRGFTFVEALVGLAVFLLISTVTIDSYLSLLEVVNLSRHKVAATDLANEQFEIARNLPYADVGIVSGIPSGLIPHTQTLTRDNVNFEVVSTVRNIDQPFDGILGGSPNDLSPADNKLLEVEIICESCPNFNSMKLSTIIAPKDLEQSSNNGALFVRVFDANGVAVPSATVHIENNFEVPAIAVDDVTGVNGLLQLVDVPPGVNAYEVTISKSGFSSESTVLVSGGNPNPEKPHATVAEGAVTQVSFAIDRVSSINFSSVTDVCGPVPNFAFNMTSAKLIGTTPDIPKYDVSHTTLSNGTLNLSDVEWGTYFFEGVDSTYDLIGINPSNTVSINPASSQNVQFILAPKEPNRLLVTIKDAVTLLPVSEATVELAFSGGSTIDTKITGQGHVGQTNWAGGEGQESFADKTMDWLSDGNIDVDEPVGEIKLHELISGDYEAIGELESSTFDTGSFSVFHFLSWVPLNQPMAAGPGSVRLQAAANNDGSVWNFIGPDGTASSFYTAADQNTHPSMDGNRYFRYKVFLSTDDQSLTPNIADVNFTFTSFCTPAGQVDFPGLSLGGYDVTVSRTGYQTVTVPVTLGATWQEQAILLNPE